MEMLVIGIGAVVVVLGLLAGAYFIFGRRRTVVEERLGQVTGANVQAPVVDATGGARPSPVGQALDQAVQGFSFAGGIKSELARADLKLTVGEYLALHVILAFAGFGLGWFLGGSWFVGLVAGVGGAILIPRSYVGYMQGDRLKKFDGQLGDMLNLVVNGLRAGYSSMQALESVSRELPAPISVEFKRVVQEIQLGIPQEQALANLTRRIPSPDLDFVVTAINVQREVGGNLAEILDTISATIRERVRIKGEIETLTAQGQMTGYVISFLPIGLSFFLYLVNPTYMGQVFGPPIMFGIPICGVIMICTALGLIGSGFFIVQKIVDIQV
jgi:tight adherence protein B